MEAPKGEMRYLLIALWVFFVANGASYVLRSTDYGMPGIRDGFYAIGFPFVFFQRGGFAGGTDFSISYLGLDAAFALVLACMVYLLMPGSKSDD